MSSWRLVVDGAADGAWNMALDEALLDWYVAHGADAPPTLRLYGWNPAALSLGRFQRAADACDREYLRAERLDLVRRPTGGGAVLHEHERTYAVAGRLGEGPFPGGVIGTYGRIAQALVAAYETLGIGVRAAPGSARAPRDAGASCFAAPSAHEILWRGRKLAGSAQVRRGRAFLQHGSIPLRLDPERLASAVGQPADGGRFVDATTAAGREVSPAELDTALIEGFAGELGNVERIEAPAEWVEAATRLRAGKYLDTGWTLDGVRP